MMLNDPPALKGHDNRRALVKRGILVGIAAVAMVVAGLAGCSSNKSNTTANTRRLRAVRLWRLHRHSGLQSGFRWMGLLVLRCLDSAVLTQQKLPASGQVLHRSGRRKPFMGTANWPGSRRPADPASVTNCLFYRPSWALSVRKSCHRSIRSTCRQWRKLRGHDRRRPRPIGASDEPIRAARTG
jgi:hypothetical protein